MPVSDPRVEGSPQFLSQQLAEHWSYIRHVEEMRLKHANVYLIILGAVLGAFAMGAKRNEQGERSIDLWSELVRQAPLSAGSLFLLFLYGLFLAQFILRQKRAYEKYRDINIAITSWFVSALDPRPFEPDAYPRSKTRPSTPLKVFLRTPFLYSYLLVVIVNTAALLLSTMLFATVGHLPSWGVMTIAAVTFLVSLVLQLMPYWNDVLGRDKV